MILATITTPLGADVLVIDRMSAEEHLSGLFHIDVSLTSKNTSIDFDAIVGKDVTIKLTAPTDTPRYFHGMVARFVQGASNGGVHLYRADIYPKLWLLTLSTDYRIFQQQTVPAIVKELLTEHGVTDVKDDLKGSYTARDYCVQYGETAFDFISRLMEEEGIFYFFKHEDGKHTVVLADDSASHTANSPEEIKLQPPGFRGEVADVVLDVGYQKQLVTGGSDVLDYHFETPSTKLKSTVAGTATTGKFKAVENPGNFTKKDAGDKIAKLRAEAQEVAAVQLNGIGTARGFSAGHKFKLTDHPRDAFNQSYVLSSVTHWISPEGYQNGFEAFPHSAPFRPALRTPKPRVFGAQTAVVVGPSGEKIHTDKYGRIKVQFHWDTRGTSNEKSSCFIRVAQDWAGKSYGSFFLPRVGQEVLISFLEGDVDRPIVIGSVYNAEQTVAYALPANQTRSWVKTQTEGTVHNELRFEDKKDTEEIWLQAAKDFKAEVVNDRTWTVKHDSIETVTNDRTATVSDGNEKLVVTKGNRTVDIDAGNETLTVKKGNLKTDVQTGDETHLVKGKRTVTVTGDEKHSSAKVDWDTSGNFTLKVTGNVVIDATGNITLKAGQNVTVQGGQNVTVEATNALSNKGLNVTTEAKAALKNKSSGTFDNEATGPMNSKSTGPHTVESTAMLNVKSAAILNVQGTLVKIN